MGPLEEVWRPGASIGDRSESELMSHVQDLASAPIEPISEADAAGDVLPVADGGRRGWLVIAALSLVGFMMYGGGLYAFIVLANPVAQEFHWDRASTGGLVSAFWLSAPLAFWAGPLIRRFGVRRLTIGGLIIEALALACLVEATQLWQMYVLRAIAGLGKVLFAISIPVVVGQWFSRRFGTALALAFAGWNLGGLLMAPLTGWLIGVIGWRATSIVVGGAILVVSVLPAYWATGHAPGPRGSEQSGGHSSAGATQAPEEFLTGLRALKRNRSFTWIASGGAVYYLTYTGLLAHQPNIITSSHVSSTIASLALGSTAGLAAVACVVIGWLTDRLPIQRLSVLLIGLMFSGAAALLTLTMIPTTALLILHILCFGAAVGGSDVYWAAAVKRSVSSASFPMTYGVWYFIALASAVTGPVVVGALIDHTHNYPLTIAIEAALLLYPLFVMTVVGRSFKFSAD